MDEYRQFMSPEIQDSPGLRRTLAETKKEFLASNKVLVAKYGAERVHLAVAKFNFEVMWSQLDTAGCPDHILNGVRAACEYALTHWGTLAQIDMKEIEPIVEGLRTQVGIVMGDINDVLKSGEEKNGTPAP